MSTWTPEYRELWPKPEDEWLLRAALSEGSACADDFTKWRSEAGLKNYDEIEYITCRVLPLVYKQLLRLGIDDPWLPKMKSLHRYHWVTTKAKQQRMVELVGHFGRAGIDTLVLKGNALIAGGYFDDAGDRPLQDIDILIRPEDQEAASDQLRSLGWDDVGPDQFVEYHSYNWRSPDGVLLDLHRKLFQPPYPFVGLDSLWAHSKEVELFGAPVRIPDPTHLLMHCVVHGRVCWGTVPNPILWIVDAMRILQHASVEIDWGRLESEARRFHITFNIRETLGYLRSRFDASVPDEWLSGLVEIELSREEMLPFFRWTHQQKLHSLLEVKDFLDADYRCHQQMIGQAPSGSGYVRYACSRLHRLLTTDVGHHWIGNFGRKLRTEGLIASIRRPDYFKFVDDDVSLAGKQNTTLSR